MAEQIDRRSFDRDRWRRMEERLDGMATRLSTIERSIDQAAAIKSERDRATDARRKWWAEVRSATLWVVALVGFAFTVAGMLGYGP